MASPSKSSPKKCPMSLIDKLGLKPLNTHNILFFYVPLQSATSYASLSVNVVNPSLMAKVTPRSDITSMLLANSILGSGLYIYNRPHLQRASVNQRILFSAYGAVVFSFGSVLLWAVIRSLLPEQNCVCTILGLSSSVALIGIGTKYLDYLDAVSGS
ncbi:uncharacterized protein LOC124160843 [Ischnura elegans]|uniref:uncharacterized protein LOC124160843 n=1 Tax=Ischnura elegans TaxID=197161 RepID=UPI001ED8669F|nr:uncharacterized protein LOC124160843 [Ischnura elegans]